MDTTTTNSTTTFTDVFSELVNKHSEECKKKHVNEAKALRYSASAARKNQQKEVNKILAMLIAMAITIIMMVVMIANWLTLQPKDIEAPPGFVKSFITTTVSRGDTLDAIIGHQIDDGINASIYRFQDLKKEVIDINGIHNPDVIYPGQQIKLPVIHPDEEAKQ
jgi:hypothetical protein